MISISTSSASGRTATVAADVWILPDVSVSGTRWTRCTPPSNLNLDQAPSPVTMNEISLKPPSPVSFSEMTSTLKPRLAAYIAQRPEKWLLTDVIPTLGEARGRLVLLRRWEDEAGLGAAAGIPFLWEDQKGHGDTSLNTVLTDEGAFRLWVQDRFEYENADKWAAFTAGLAAPAGEGDVVLSFLSTKGEAAYGHPYQFAEKLNQRLLDLEPEAIRGWIPVDYLSPALAEAVYRVNFA